MLRTLVFAIAFSLLDIRLFRAVWGEHLSNPHNPAVEQPANPSPRMTLFDDLARRNTAILCPLKSFEEGPQHRESTSFSSESKPTMKICWFKITVLLGRRSMGMHP